MGNTAPTPQAPTGKPASVQSVQVDTDQVKRDSEFDDRPLYVLYGAPWCKYCVLAADLLVKKQKDHCKIGADYLREALDASKTKDTGTIPQIFSCPSAELLLDVAGKEPGALGASAHGAVKASMCAHIGGYTELAALFDAEGKTQKA
eukprot:CAMPEP_0172599426 /NCGR_PEP_ID=MMETSP1068-20121228/19519_1 /TAXON_ID=35684 /ORGANISM="Pseudopedinella elastica, Strain CCMP716" /LENGTH=146 /DNA_ID=CAMNT_0013399675 /DNA_START=3 /DNA_END=443 /DNA_ORIENTATION=-